MHVIYTSALDETPLYLLYAERRLIIQLSCCHAYFGAIFVVFICFLIDELLLFDLSRKIRSRRVLLNRRPPMACANQLPCYLDCPHL